MKKKEQGIIFGASFKLLEAFGISKQVKFIHI